MPGRCAREIMAKKKTPKKTAGARVVWCAPHALLDVMTPYHAGDVLPDKLGAYIIEHAGFLDGRDYRVEHGDTDL